MSAYTYNVRERMAGRLTPAHVAYLLTQARSAGLEHAVETFQAAHKLTADGFAGPLTRAAIDAEMARPRPPPTQGFGPVGFGLYARGWLLDPSELVAELREIGAVHVAIFPSHVKRGAPKALDAAGIPWRLFSTPLGDGIASTPDSWAPDQYHRTIAAFESIVLGEGGAGVIADTENKWPQATHAERLLLGQHLVEFADRMREHGKDVGMTTFLSHPLRREIGRLCGDDVYCSTQLYAPRPRATNAQILTDELQLGWQVSIPSTAAYLHFDSTPGVTGGMQARARTADEWRETYDDFPAIRGTFVWPVGNIKGPLAAEMKRWAKARWP